MKKMIKMSCALVLLGLIITGCNNTNTEDKKDEITTVTDLLGREVSLNLDSIKKVVCIGGGALRLYSYIGDMSLLSGVEKVEQGYLISIRPYQMLNEELFKSLPLCGNGGPSGKADAEAILNCDPDLIISLYTQDKAAMDDLSTKTNTPVVTLSYGSNEAFDQNVITSLELLGKIFHKEDRATELTTYINTMKTDLDDRTKDIKDEDKPSIYLGCQSNYGLKGFESSSANYSLFNASNIKNVLDVNGYKGYQKEVDIEKLVVMDPDKIILDAGGLELFKAEYADSTKATVYNSLSAIKNGEVYLQMPYNAYYTNLETAYCDAYYDSIVSFPEQFKDINIENKANEITKMFLGTEFYSRIADEMYGGYQKLSIPTVWPEK
ncbi:MAG: ABC transporter substrate-binding protein [Bacilli bacterium]|jgi:iron complex transport system substrate-binding protein